MFAACQQCPDGQLQIRPGYAVVRPEQGSLTGDLSRDWAELSRLVQPAWILFCTGCGAEDAGVGFDGQTPVPPYGLRRITNFLTDPDLVIVPDLIVQQTMRERGTGFRHAVCTCCGQGGLVDDIGWCGLCPAGVEVGKHLHPQR
ncbi:MAG: hypothetical protein ABWY93_04760 [Mycobacterium sp.]